MKNFITIITLLFSFCLYSQSDFQPEEEYIEGRLVKTLNIENVEVSTSLRSIQRSDGKYYTFDIYVLNKSALKKVMKVNSFKAYLVQLGKKKNKREELQILSNKEYQDKKKKRGNFRAIMAAMGGAAQAQDAGRKTSTTNTNINSSTYGTSNTSADINAYDSYGLPAGSATVDATTNSYSNTNTNATSTTQSYDGAAAYAARQNEERKLREMMERQAAAKSKWNDMYLKSETLDAMESVTGLVNVKYKKGDLIDLIIYVGNVEFIFEWNPDDSEF